MKRLAAITLGIALAGIGTVTLASRNSSGTYSLPGAYNPVISGSTITSTWANTTLSDLGSEITSSLDRSGKGGMLAPIRTPDGTIAAPAHSFTNETGMGFYRSSAGNWALAIAGGNVITATSTAANIPVATFGLTKAGDQSITKSGSGTLTVYNSVASGNVIVTAGTNAYVVMGSPIAMGNQIISGVATPSADADAATKGYVDTPAVTTATWTGVTGCTSLEYAKVRGVTYIRGTLTTSGGTGTIACSTTVAAGYRPITVGASGVLTYVGSHSGQVLISTGGVISTNGVTTDGSHTIANFSFPAEQ